MKFLAIDTSGRYLTVLAYADGRTSLRYEPDCAMAHSTRLMDAVDGALRTAGLSLSECDFLASVVGPGSFTGIRIGISTVKGLCFSCDKPALALTSFDPLAYHTGEKPIVALVDAGHDFYYTCCYFSDKTPVSAPRYASRGEVEALIGQGFCPVASEPLFPGCEVADPSRGMLPAVLSRAGEAAPASLLKALYLRKSSAEEHRS